MYDILELSKKLLPELRDIAKQLNIKKAEALKKQDLIYKILDQQAIEATDTKKPDPVENERFSYASDIHKNEAEALLRRGKRPRTSKPGPARPVESVMTVSPEGMKITEQKPYERHEREPKSEIQEVKPDKPKPFVKIIEERKENKWAGRQNEDSGDLRRERSEKQSEPAEERHIQEQSAAKVLDDTAPLAASDLGFEEKAPSTDIYYGDIIVEAPVK